MIRHILFALAAAASVPSLASAQPAPTATTIQMDRISVQVIGKGSPVILIPGLGSPRAAWDAVSPELARAHSVYLVQVNGFAGDDPRGNLKPGLLEGVVADLRALIAQRKLKNSAVVGHSMGGLVGLMLAARHPEAVDRLMVVDALPFFAVQMAPPGTELTVAMVAPRAAQMRDAVAASFGKPASRAAAEASVATMVRRPEARAKAAEWAMAADPRVVSQALYENLTTDMRGQLKAIRAPVTLAYAWNEEYPRQAPADAYFRTQYAELAHARYVGIGDSGHMIMLDQPDALRAALKAFLVE